MTGVGEGADAELKSSAMEDSIRSTTQTKPLYPPPHFSPYNFYPPPPANIPFPDPSASSVDVYPPPAYPPPPPTGSMQGPSPFHHQWPPVEPHGYTSWSHWPYCFPYPSSYPYPCPCYSPIHHHQPHHGLHPHPPHFSAGDYDGAQQAAPATPTQNPIAFGSAQVDTIATNGLNGMNTCASAAVGMEEIGNPNELYPPPPPVPHIFPGVQGGETGLEALVSIAVFIQQQFAASRDAVKPQVDLELEVGGTPTPTPSSVLPQETEEEEEDSSVKVAAVDNQQTPVEQLDKSLSHASEETSSHLGYPSYDYWSSQYQYDQQHLYPPPSSYCNPYPPSYGAPSWGGPTADPSVLSESTNNPAQENSKPIPEHSYDQGLYPPPQYHHYPYYPPPHYGPGFPAPPPVFSDSTNSAGDIPSNSGTDYWKNQYQQHHHQYPHFPPFHPFPHPHCHYPSCWPQPSSSGLWQNQNYSNSPFSQPQSQQPNFPPSTPPPMLYPDAKHPYTQYFKDLIKSFMETQKTNLEDVEDGTVEHQTWEKGNILEGLVDDEGDDEEEPQYVLTEEWAEFFAKAEARRKEKKGQAKKQAKAARKAAKTSDRTQTVHDIVKSLENTTLNGEDEGNKVDEDHVFYKGAEEHVLFKGAEDHVQETSPDHKQDLVRVGVGAEGRET